jgi:hypothetical protein
MVIVEVGSINYAASTLRTLSSEYNRLLQIPYTTNLKPPQNGRKIKYPDPNM